jgi:UDP-N-acetylglucosamine 2-epimerase (non-hydrolysing)
MTQSYLSLTDSGGVQEEGPSLNKPVLVMRETSERPEAIESGAVKLVGTNADFIIESVESLLREEETYKQMADSLNPYGDGTASKQILAFIKSNLL